MTVKDLIKDLMDMPQDIPVICNVKEITDVKYDEVYYLNEKDERSYDAGPVVVLE